jgi:3-mercaptopyruvate sulfurtransferase SseA
MLEPETNSSTEAPMAFPVQEIRANRDYFVHKLQAEKQRNDVLKAVEEGKFDFVLLDTRGREPFASGHIPGAWCAPEEEIERLAPLLPADKELVTYCWGHD